MIHVKSGTVIGIATLSIRRELKTFGSDSKFNSVERRFAQRIDSISAFEPITPAAFESEALTLEQIKNRTELLLRLFTNASGNGDVHPLPTGQPTEHLNRLVSTYLSDMAALRMNRDRTARKQRFVRDLLFETKVDVLQVNSGSLSSYHKKILEDEVQFRHKMSGALEQWLNSQKGTL